MTLSDIEVGIVAVGVGSLFTLVMFLPCMSNLSGADNFS